MASPRHPHRSTGRRGRRGWARGAPASGLLLLSAAAVALAVAAAASARPAATLRLDVPAAAEIARGSAAIADTSAPKRLVLPGSYWGGTYTASTGETVTIYVSSRYPQDPATAQRWADFLASLVHGPELSDLILYLAPSSTVSRICGADAVACYGAADNLLVAPGDDPASDLSAEAVVTHEYGHHVAAHRSNAPWQAVDWGTKRWATYERICSGAETGRFFPGAEALPQYELNPGEAFAETYRVLNERKAGLAEPPWQIVSNVFAPDGTALSLVEQDVTTPWQSATTTVRTSTLTRTSRVRTFTVATPLDGALAVTVRAPARMRVAVDVTSASSGAALAHATGTRSVSVSATLCGDRTVKVRVARVSGTATGSIGVTVAVP